MNIKRTVSIIGLILIIVIGACGCMKNRESIESQTLGYLESKYMEEFEIISSIPSGMDVPYDEIYAYSASYPNKRITVYREKIGTEYNFSDNYFGIIKEAEYSRLLKSAVDTVFNKSRVYFVFLADFFESEYTASTDLSAVFQKDKSALQSSIRVFVPNTDYSEQEFETKCHELFEVLQIKNFYTTISVYFIDEEALGTLSEDNYEQYLRENSRSTPTITEVIK